MSGHVYQGSKIDSASFPSDVYSLLNTHLASFTFYHARLLCVFRGLTMGKFDRFSAPCLVNKLTDCTRLTSPGDFNEDFTNAFVALTSLACCFSLQTMGVIVTNMPPSMVFSLCGCSFTFIDDDIVFRGLCQILDPCSSSAELLRHVGTVQVNASRRLRPPGFLS